MIFFIIPASVALALKLWLLASPSKRSWAGSKWVGFVLILASLNLAEVLIYTTSWYQLSPDSLLRSYYVCCVISLLYSFIYVMDDSQFPVQRAYAITASAVAGTLVFLLIFTEHIISGYTTNSIPAFAVKGQFYWTFSLFALIQACATMYTLIYNYIKTDDPRQQAAHAYTLRAMSWMAATTIFVMGGKLLGFETNGTAILPIATTAFLLISYKGKNSYFIGKDPRAFPLTREASTSRQLQWTHAQFGINDLGLKDSLIVIEAALISQKLHQHKGNKSATAHSLGLSLPGLEEKLQRFGLSVNIGKLPDDDTRP